MLDWLRVIGEFIIHRITAVFEIFQLGFQSIALLYSAFAVSPSFLYPVLSVTLAVIVVMWVVNIF